MHWLKPSLLGMAAAVLATSLPATAKEKISLSYLIDPVYEAVIWPLKNGKVASDTVKLEPKALSIVALIQAVGSKTFDISMAAVAGIPPAKARGLDLVVVATGYRAHPKGGGYDIFVRSDSPLKSIDQLKGKTLGSYALRATATTHLRIALAKKHGANVAINGGDYKWVEMPSAALPGALLSGRVDAATLLNTQAWKAGKDPQFRTLIRLGRDVHEVFGGPPASAIFVSYPEKLAARPAVFKEALRMLKASADYTKSHKDEVYAAVAKATGTETALFEFFYETYAQVPMAVSAADVASMNRLWEYTKEMGLIKSYPKAESVIWDGAIRE